MFGNASLLVMIAQNAIIFDDMYLQCPGFQSAQIPQRKNFRPVLPSFGRFPLLFSVHFPNWLSNLAPQSAEKSLICRGIVRSVKESLRYRTLKVVRKSDSLWSLAGVNSKQDFILLRAVISKRNQDVAALSSCPAWHGIEAPHEIALEANFRFTPRFT